MTPVVLPFVTPTPGGGTFQGAIFFPHLNNGGDLLFDGLILTDKEHVVRAEGFAPGELTAIGTLPVLPAGPEDFSYRRFEPVPAPVLAPPQ